MRNLVINEENAMDNILATLASRKGNQLTLRCSESLALQLYRTKDNVVYIDDGSGRLPITIMAVKDMPDISRPIDFDDHDIMVISQYSMISGLRVENLIGFLAGWLKDEKQNKVIKQVGRNLSRAYARKQVSVETYA